MKHLGDKSMKKFLAAFLILATTTAHASGSRILDGQQITNGAAVLTLPAATDTMVGRLSTDTLTNKSISGATNTLSAIPVSALASGTAISVPVGGTGLTTVTTNGILFGAGTSALSIASPGSQYQVFQAGAAGVPSFGALNLNQAAAVSGSLGVANGGTGSATLTSGSLVVGAGTSAVTFIAPGSSGNVLTSNGSVWSSTAPVSTSPSLNGGSASPQTVTAGGGVVLSSISYQNLAWISAASAITVTKTPSITVGTADGQKLNIYGTSASNTITLQDQANLASSGLSLNGNWIGGKDSSLNLHWDASQSLWVEDSRR
jgi:hypothetical protein